MKHILELKCEQMIDMCEKGGNYGVWNDLTEGQKKYLAKFAREVLRYIEEKEKK